MKLNIMSLRGKLKSTMIYFASLLMLCFMIFVFVGLFTNLFWEGSGLTFFNAFILLLIFGAMIIFGIIFLVIFIMLIAWRMVEDD